MLGSWIWFKPLSQDIPYDAFCPDVSFLHLNGYIYYRFPLQYKIQRVYFSCKKIKRTEALHFPSLYLQLSHIWHKFIEGKGMEANKQEAKKKLNMHYNNYVKIKQSTLEWWKEGHQFCLQILGKMRLIFGIWNKLWNRHTVLITEIRRHNLFSHSLCWNTLL